MTINVHEATSFRPARPTESIVGIGYELLIDASQTARAYEVMHFVVPAGHGPPLHVHRREAECFYVLDGEFDVVLGEKTLHVQAGECIHLPPGIPHAFRNTTDRTGSFLCWVIPGNLAGFFDAFKRPWPPADEHPPPVEEADIARLMSAAAEYGIEILAGE